MSVEDVAVKPLDVACPTCSADKGANCVKLATLPGGRVGWVSALPHLQRRARVLARG